MGYPYSSSVFLNVPFDQRYKKLLDALVFAVHDCGLTARSALEFGNSGDNRFARLVDLIHKCRFGIHDLSRTTLDSANRLPRFNMPLELGLFLGARGFGGRSQQSKVCLILEKDRYRYQKFCSDLAGQDIRAHNNEVEVALTAVRNWIQANTNAKAVPGPAALRKRYIDFRRDLPQLCDILGLSQSELTFIDYRNLVSGWIANRDS